MQAAPAPIPRRLPGCGAIWSGARSRQRGTGRGVLGARSTAGAPGLLWRGAGESRRATVVCNVYPADLAALSVAPRVRSQLRDPLWPLGPLHPQVFVYCCLDTA
jgi:hypothetical protein